jgi:hypothetical protein
MLWRCAAPLTLPRLLCAQACRGCNWQVYGASSLCSTGGPYAQWAGPSMPSGADWALAVYTAAPSPSPPPPPTPPPPVPMAPLLSPRTPTANGWTYMQQTSLTSTPAWIQTFPGSSRANYQQQYSASSGASNQNTLSLTSGYNQATAAVITGPGGAPFLVPTMCGQNTAGFSMKYSFSLSLASGGYNSIADGITVSFMPSNVAPASIVWGEDANSVLVPSNAPTAITLEIDTCACDALAMRACYATRALCDAARTCCACAPRCAYRRCVLPQLRYARRR